MPADDPTTPLAHDNPDASRFEAVVDGHTAELVYRREGSTLELVHTEVPPDLEGRGLGGRLVEAALAVAARDGLTVVPRCPFARAWLRRHPEAAVGVTIVEPH
jgi:predicted GNAT family acetyltransferase